MLGAQLNDGHHGRYVVRVKLIFVAVCEVIFSST